MLATSPTLNPETCSLGVYFAATLDAAIWGAESALGDGQERINVVEPTGPIVDDPNVKDKSSPAIQRCPIDHANRCEWWPS